MTSLERLNAFSALATVELSLADWTDLKLLCYLFVVLLGTILLSTWDCATRVLFKDCSGLVLASSEELRAVRALLPVLCAFCVQLDSVNTNDVGVLAGTLQPTVTTLMELA